MATREWFGCCPINGSESLEELSGSHCRSPEESERSKIRKTWSVSWESGEAGEETRTRQKRGSPGLNCGKSVKTVRRNISKIFRTSCADLKVSGAVAWYG